MSDQAIDDLDVKIIAQLQGDGRKPVTDIARDLGIPRTTVARRLERLIRDNTLTIGAYADGAKIGLPVQVMIELWIDPARLDAVIAALADLVEIRWVGIAAGPFDLLVEAIVRSDTHLRHLLLSKLGHIEGITQIRTAHILQVAKITFDWERMLRAGEEAERLESGDNIDVVAGVRLTH